MNKKLTEQISAMNEVDKVYELIEWRSFNLNNQEATVENEIKVIKSSSAYSVKYSLNNSEKDYYTALPYFKEQKLDKRLYKRFASEKAGGAYITYDLAEELELLDVDDEEVKIEFNIGVPINKLVYVDDVSQEEMDLDLAEFRKITITVNGILEQSVKNTYTINGNSTIYLPYEYMINAMEKSKGRGTASSCETYQMKEWEPSAVVVVLVIIFALMCAVYINTTVGRKREYAILKAMGFSLGRLRDITILESMIQAVKILIFSLLFSNMATVIFCRLLLGSIELLSIKIVIVVALASVFFVSIPSVVSIMYVSRLKVEKIIRN